MSTFLSLHYHLVFSTKDRRPLMDARWRSKLHDYLGATVKGLHGYPQGIGGMADHVHLLVGLNATHCLADFMRELKKAATKWVQHEIRLPDFAWQEGYGAFTAAPPHAAPSANTFPTRRSTTGSKHFARSWRDFSSRPGLSMKTVIWTEGTSGAGIPAGMPSMGRGVRWCRCANHRLMAVKPPA